MVDALCDDIGPELVTNFQVGGFQIKMRIERNFQKHSILFSESRGNRLLPTSIFARAHHILSQVGLDFLHLMNLLR